jgi:hypothetical protein
MSGRYNTKEKSKLHVTKKRNDIPEQISMLADGNKGGQPDQAGKLPEMVRWRQ